MWSASMNTTSFSTPSAVKLFRSSFLWSICLILIGINISGVTAQSNIPIITKDVAILGGGASGTYAAVRLREDYGKSIVVIEQEGVLGGHTNTYTDPTTNTALNYGVLAYIDYGGAKDFFGCFNISIEPYEQFNSTTVFVDPESGKVVPNINTPSLSDADPAIAKYLSIIEPWNDILLPGYWNFPAGNDIPPDLLLPWVEFLDKHGLQDMAPALSVVAGIPTNSTTPTLYNVMNFGTPVASGYLNSTFFRPNPYNNSLLYGRAEDLLVPDLMFSSTVLQGNRSNDGVTLLVQNQQTGDETIVKAKRLLVTAQPYLSNLEPLQLDEQEEAVFSTFGEAEAGYTAVVKTNILPDNTSIQFVPSSDASPPYVLVISWNGEPNFFSILFGGFGSQYNTVANAKQAILASFKTLADGGAFPPPEGEEPSYEIVAFADHSGISYNQTVEQLQNGFMQQLYALQGHQSTWYTGQTWCPDYSSNVWAFTDTVLPKLVSSLE